MKLLHVITALNVGGAETMLAKLLEHPAPGRHPLRQEVLSLMAPGAIGARVAASGVPLHSIDMREGKPSIAAFGRLVRMARQIQPELIIGWMHHGQLAATIAARSIGTRPPVIWNVRRSLSDIRHEKMMVRGVLRLCAALSRTPAAIVYNSSVARAQYERYGYRADRALVVPNGFDSELYRPNADARAALARTFGIDDGAVVVGMVARAHPMKDVDTLVEAVRRARARGADVHLLVAGSGMDSPTSSHAALIASTLPTDRVTLVGHRADVSRWLPGLDILALPSAWGEGFPNIVGEAMACGVPCLATDIGDSRSIIGDTGVVVAPRDPDAMAEGLLALVALGLEGRRDLGIRARARVIDHFSMPEIAARYAALYDAALDAREGAAMSLAMPAGGVPHALPGPRGGVI